jgi:hypothetical protein
MKLFSLPNSEPAYSSCLSPTGWSRIKIPCGRPGSCSSVTTIRQNERPKDKKQRVGVVCRMASEHMCVLNSHFLISKVQCQFHDHAFRGHLCVYQRKATKKYSERHKIYFTLIAEYSLLSAKAEATKSTVNNRAIAAFLRQYCDWKRS